MSNSSVLKTESTDVFRERLKDLMKKYNEDNKALAKIAEVSENTVSSWFVGKYREKDNQHYYPTIKQENIEKLCKHYNVSATWLFGIDEHKTLSKQEIGDLIGLSDDSIDTLEKWADRDNPNIESMFVLDTLLTSAYSETLINALYQYLVSDNSFPIWTEYKDGTIKEQQVYDPAIRRLDYIMPCKTYNGYEQSKQTDIDLITKELLRASAINALTQCLENIRKEKVSPDPAPPKRRGRPPKEKGGDAMI